jgi:hypothetical protein
LISRRVRREGQLLGLQPVDDIAPVLVRWDVAVDADTVAAVGCADIVAEDVAVRMLAVVADVGIAAVGRSSATAVAAFLDRIVDPDRSFEAVPFPVGLGAAAAVGDKYLADMTGIGLAADVPSYQGVDLGDIAYPSRFHCYSCLVEEEKDNPFQEVGDPFLVEESVTSRCLILKKFHKFVTDGF